MALKKNPNPTFKSIVEIPVPGEKPEKVEFTFKYKNKADYNAFIESCKDRDDPESSLEIIAAWGLDDVYGPASKESVGELFNAYPGAPGAIFTAFVKGLHQGRLGN